VPGPPFRDRGVSLTLAQCVSQVYIGEAYHPYRSRLDHCHRVAGGVDNDLPQSRARQRLALMLVICHQPACRGLAARHDRSDELIAQRPGEAKLRDWQTLGWHNGKPSEAPHASPGAAHPRRQMRTLLVPRRRDAGADVLGTGSDEQSCGRAAVRSGIRCRWDDALVKIVLAGGSGALGRRLAAAAAGRGDDVVVLTRSARAASACRQVEWDGRTVGSWREELGGAVVVNLAGELVDRRPTAANVRLLTESRVQPTRALAAAAAQVRVRPTVWVQMSTLAIYGDSGEAVLDESAAPADGPVQMAGVARAWEEAAAGVPADRQVVLRAGVVLDRGTPALERLTGLTRCGLGGRIGAGRQWISWLHIEDFLGIVERVITDETLRGVVHATSPQPVRNRELMAALRAVLRRPPAPPTPVPLVRLGALLLRTDPALALTGRRAIPGRLQEAGFRFRYPELAAALEHLLAGQTQARGGSS